MPVHKNTARFLTGASALTLIIAAPALAGTYHATDDASLRAALTSAAADPDSSATVILDNDVTMSGAALSGNTKPITIDTNGHTYTTAYGNGSTSFGAVNLNGTSSGSIFILNGNFQAAGAGAGASGTGDQGLFANAGKTITNNGTITGGAGGGLGGNGGTGASIIGASSVTNTGAVTGGSAGNGTGGTGVNLSSGGSLNNSGTVRGGDGLSGGIGVNAISVPNKTILNSGTIMGGKGSTGSGGDGVRVTQGNGIDNSGTITGGDGAFGGAGVNITGLNVNNAIFTNSGTIMGGNGSGGTGGNGVIVHSNVGTMTNTGTITGGAGAAAIMNTGIIGATNAPVTLINSGTIAAGTGYDTAILMQTPSNLTLELRKGSAITGNVVGNTGAAANTLVLGGDNDASFDVSKIGPQYQNFTAYQKTGTSVWTLTGTGSVATPWTIAQGTLQIGDGASVIGDVADNATLAFNNSTALTFANAVTGTGGVNQTGSGRTNLTGASTYSGPTTISAGTLAVNGSILSAVTVQSGGTLGGNGTVGATTIQSGGNIAPGNSIGTLHINGAFAANASSTYQLEADPTSNASDLILVNGAAAIAGGAKLNIVANPSGIFQSGARYTILTASGGVTGRYDDPAPLSQYLAFQETQDPNNIYLTVIQTGDPSSAAQTGNQGAVAGGVPAGSAIATGLLNSPSEADARNAFDRLSGEAIASTRGAVVSGSLLVRDTALDRLRDVCSADETARHPGCLNQDRPLVWVQGFGNWGRIGGNANAAALSHATGGFLIGTDVPVYDWRLGFFGGYSRTDFHVDARTSSGSSDNYHLGAYGGTNLDGLGIRLGASYSWNALSTERLVAFGNFSNDLTATYNAGTAQIFGEVGERFTFDRLGLEPFANLSYLNLRTAAFREGGGDAALSALANTQEDTFATIGLRPSTDFSILSLPLELKGMFGWRHTFGAVTPSATLAFAGGNAFTVTGAPIARDAGVVEAGLSANITGSAAINLTYGAQFGGRESNNGIRGTLAVAF